MPSVSLIGLLTAVLSWLIGLLLFALMLITCIDVIGRYGFNAPLPGANEITELAMGVLVFAALPLVTARSEHVTVDLLKPWLQRSRYNALRQRLIGSTSALLLALMSWRLWLKGLELASYGDTSSYLHAPLAPFAYFMSATAATAALLLATMIVAPPFADKLEPVANED